MARCAARQNLFSHIPYSSSHLSHGYGSLMVGPCPWEGAYKACSVFHEINSVLYDQSLISSVPIDEIISYAYMQMNKGFSPGLMCPDGLHCNTSLENQGSQHCIPREPSPTKDPLPMTDEMRRSLGVDSVQESNGIGNHSSKSRPGSPTTATDSEHEG